ncbi:MAG TPA: di-heme oxidoredictase family protein [Gemmatimonadaceae bacterium]|nr:di-heme oxidoredictase family protein [Gemmatimonadaceae bacterium]
MAKRFLAAAATGALATAIACSDLLTTLPNGADLLDSPLPELTETELAAFLRGDEEFGRPFSVAEGLGPLFNDVSCAACHSGDGRGHPRNTLTRIGDPSNDFLPEMGGPQIQIRAIPGVTAEAVPAGTPLSLRLPPPVFGAGLIEAITESAILANVDSLDANVDGISGRPNWVTPAEYIGVNGSPPPRAIGRFGRKAAVSNLLQQVVEAYHQDMGITSDFRPLENLNPNVLAAGTAADRAPDPEIPVATVQSVVHYVRTLAPPAPGAMTASRTAGSATFAAIGCASCHVPSMQTGANSIGALSARTVTLYSDLLLHDMGDALADNRVDGDANGREWRTAPLWGLRLVKQFLDGQAYYLHDGRARTLDEAIRLHGGEAQAVRDAYVALTDAQRAALLDFVGSR